MTPPPVPLPDDAPPGVYVHIPFCRYVCPYCDFNVYAGQQDIVAPYIDAVERELELIASQVNPPTGVATVFIGGGTPSLLTPTQIARIVEAIDSTVGISAGAEVSMESNPDNLTAGYCQDLLAAGINRLSIGVQSLQQPGLKVLGRLHGAAGARAAYDAARTAGCGNISLDFIYGWPGQSRSAWAADLDEVVGWEPDHLSLYALIVEAGTPMDTAVRRGQLVPVDDDETAAFYDLASDTLDRAGWEHYEISNWTAQSAQRSVHNQIYWQNGRYVGVGAGAHGYLGDQRYSNHRLPGSYVRAVESGQRPVAMSETISPELAAGETMMLGLRLLLDGVSESDFQLRHGTDIDERFGPTIDRFVEMKLMVRENGRVRLSETGALVSNSILAEFLP